MMALGFGSVALGPAGPNAEAQARVWYSRWQEVQNTPEAKALPPRARPSQPSHKIARDFVYFMQIGDRVKIGTSTKPLRRVQEIAGGAHARTDRLVIVPGNRLDERRLHDRFKASRTNGEWFEATNVILLTIGRCAVAGRVVLEDEPRTKTRPESKFRKSQSQSFERVGE